MAGQKPGLLIGVLTALDEDVSDDSFIYELCEGEGSEGNSYVIVKNNIIRSNKIFDYAKTKAFPIRVKGKDKSGAFIEKRFNIKVTNLNSNSGDKLIILSNQIVAENTQAGTIIGTLEVLNGVGKYEFSCDNEDFEVNDGMLVTAKVLDFEQQSYYQIPISTTQNNETFSTTLIIAIDNINENPTDIGFTAMHLIDSDDARQLIGRIIIDDIDGGNNYQLSINKTENTDYEFFEIDGFNLYTIKEVEDDKDVFKLDIKVTDGDLSYNAIYTFTLLKIDTAINPQVTNSQMLLMAYPNPFSNNITIVIKNNFIGNIQLELFDLNGKLLDKQVKYKPKERIEVNLAVQKLLAGVYLCRCKYGEQVSQIKLIKQ